MRRKKNLKNINLEHICSLRSIVGWVFLGLYRYRFFPNYEMGIFQISPDLEVHFLETAGTNIQSFLWRNFHERIIIFRKQLNFLVKCKNKNNFNSVLRSLWNFFFHQISHKVLLFCFWLIAIFSPRILVENTTREGW